MVKFLRWQTFSWLRRRDEFPRGSHCEESLRDQYVENARARRRVDVPPPARLAHRETQPGPFPVIGANASNQLLGPIVDWDLALTRPTDRLDVRDDRCIAPSGARCGTDRDGSKFGEIAIELRAAIDVLPRLAAVAAEPLF